MDDHERQLLLLGREHYQRGEYDKAEFLLRQVVVKADRFADVHHMLGVIAHNRGDFSEAEAHFEKAVLLNPNYTEAQLNLMVTYNDLGKYDAARRVYSQVRTRAETLPVDPFVKGKIANMHAEIGQAYYDAGMLVEAVHELEKATRLCPQFADLQVRLGVLYRDTGDILRARERFEAARASNPRFVQGRLALGTLLLGAGEREAARREFEAVTEMDPNHGAAQMYLRLTRAPLASGGSSSPGPDPTSET